MPNFFLVGAAKAGTTSLWAYLNAHPDIFMSPVKEPRYFALIGGADLFPVASDVRDLDAYLRLFKDWRSERIGGEASVAYLWHRDVPQRLLAASPEAKIAMILRDPIDRAYSNFHMLRTLDVEKQVDFRAAVAAEPRRYGTGEGYPSYLRRYWQTFGEDRVLVLFYDDLAADTLAVCRRLYTFLGVDPDFQPPLRARNVAGSPRNRWLHRRVARPAPWMTRVGRRVLSPQVRRHLVDLVLRANWSPTAIPASPTAEERAALIPRFEPAIRELEEMTGRDLSAWLRP